MRKGAGKDDAEEQADGEANDEVAQDASKDRGSRSHAPALERCGASDV